MVNDHATLQQVMLAFPMQRRSPRIIFNAEQEPAGTQFPPTATQSQSWAAK